MNPSEKLRDLHPLLTGPPAQKVRNDLWDQIVAVVARAEQECDSGGCHICGRYPYIYHGDDCALVALDKALEDVRSV